MANTVGDRVSFPEQTGLVTDAHFVGLLAGRDKMAFPHNQGFSPLCMLRCMRVNSDRWLLR